MTAGTPIQTWDEIFVRTSRARVNDVVIDVSSWPGWWPRAEVQRGDDGRHALTLRPRWPLPHVQRLDVVVDRVRPRDKGLEMTIAGDVDATAEIFHLDGPRGVVVSYLLRGRLHRSGAAARLWTAGHRGSVRAALVQLKARLERGRVAGAEPHPRLLAIQAAQMEIFAAEHALYEAEQALAAARARAEADG